MNSTPFVDFEELSFLYFQGTPAERAIAYFHEVPAERTPVELDRLLRDHRVEGIADPSEVALRTAFDELLAFYSLVEIAHLLGLVSDVPASAMTEMRAVLSHRAVRQYYEVLYPLLLPQLLRERLLGNFRVAQEPNGVHDRAFERFLDINSALDNDPDSAVFLNMLDDYYYQGIGLVQVLDALSTPETLLKKLTSPDESDFVGSGLRGFRRFLIFARSLDDLLQSIAERPTSASALWHYHGYWFVYLRDKVAGAMASALDNLTKWGREEVPESGDGVSPADSLQSMRLAVERLTSEVYRQPLVAVAHGVTEDPGAFGESGYSAER